MKLRSSTITQSKFYSPVFNAAIFDGPLRLYFAQYQESYALNIYFLTQQKLKQYLGSKEQQDAEKKNIFVMVYPSEETFRMSFEAESSKTHNGEIVVTHFEDDIVVGVNAQVEDKERQQRDVVDHLEAAIIQTHIPQSSVVEAVL